MKKLIAVAAVAITLAGCASVPMGDAKMDAQAKTFVAPQDKTGLYIYRNESMGAVAKMTVAIDGQTVGQTAAKTFIYKEVPPGKHVITSSAENTDTLEIDAKPGTLAFIWQEVKMGILSARSKLHLVTAEEGKKGVGETKLVNSN